jgi:stage II sporulation protein E
MTAASAPIITVEAARATSKKKTEEQNGDSTSVFENRENMFYALISDGMGSGEEAHMTSRITAVFLEKLLCAGNKKSTVLKMLNNFIRNKNLECFTTVDLLEIDTITSEASFVKSGAAASYIIRGGKLFKIASTSLPIGITREISSEEIRFELKGGDLIVMISDGVSQSFEDGAWLLSVLSDEINADAPLADIARSLIEKAKTKNGRNDDMSVVVLRAEECGQ